ncbi:MAG TPA: ABC transporter permease [Thermoplasmata archaeon]|nr:ABC transporter permease [Thermoplasmata archaeon]
MSTSSEVASAPKHLPVRFIRPSKGWRRLDLRELWEYRELLYFFAWRDIKVRYKQTVIGAAWAILQPVLLMVVFTLFFGQVSAFQQTNIPYPLMTYSGLVPWGVFAAGLAMGGVSITANQALITKVYFPRILLPASTVIAALVDFAIASIVLVGLMLYFGFVPTLITIALPLFVLLAIVTSMGIAFWLSALDARYRDIHYTIPFLTQLWLFATPILYPASIVPASLRWIYSLNPMVGVVDGFRWALLGQAFAFDLTSWLSVVVALLIFVSGIFYFLRVEKTLPDVV